jgi:hypothetical protein
LNSEALSFVNAEGSGITSLFNSGRHEMCRKQAQQSLSLPTMTLVAMVPGEVGLRIMDERDLVVIVNK